MRYLHGWLRRREVGNSGIARCGMLTALMLGVCFAATGQSDRGTIAGSILDISGAVVPGAAITATGADTGVVYKTTSTSVGAYRIPNMQVGVYNLSVEAKGFKTSEQEGLIVQINTTTALNVVLQPGEVVQTVTVTASGPTLQAETSEMARWWTRGRFWICLSP